MDLCIADIDGTIAEIPAEAYFVEPVDYDKCKGCKDLKIESEKVLPGLGRYALGSLFKKRKIEVARKCFCHRPSFCENKPTDKIKEIFSAEKVLYFKPIIEVRSFIYQLVKNGFIPAYVSGRPIELLFATSQWLSLAGFPIGLVATVGKDNENPIESKMKMAQAIITANNPQFIVALEDCPHTMKMYSEKFGAVDGLRMMKNKDKLLDMKKGEIKVSG